MATDIRLPISPIHGMVNTAGDATHPAFIQLNNPVASGKLLYIRELVIGQEVATVRLKMRRIASSGLTLGGTNTVGLLARRDQNDATAIVATLTGCTAVAGTIFTEAQSFWYDKPAAAGSAGYVGYSIIRPGAYPLIINQGSALEFAAGEVGASVLIRMYVAFDEIAP
jgi:hypothetical protein